MSTIPNLNVPESKKDSNWIKNIALYLSKTSVDVNRKKLDKKYWQYYNNEFDEKRMDYFLKYGNYTLPAMPRHIPLQRHLIDLLISELTIRPKEFVVRTINEEAIDEKYELIIKQLIDMMFLKISEMRMHASVKISSIDQKIQELQEYVSQEPETQEQAQELKRMQSLMPNIIAQMQLLQSQTKTQDEQLAEIKDEVERYIRFDFKEYKEEIAEKIMVTLYSLLKIKNAEKKAFRSKCVVGKQAYWVDYLEDERYPRFEALNDLMVYYPRIEGVDRINRGPWVVINELMTPQQVLIEFGEELKKNYGNDVIDKILEENQTSVNGNFGSTPEGAIEVPYSGYTTSGGIRIDRVFFKAPREEKIKVSPNPHEEGEFFRNIIDPYMKLINEDVYKYDFKKKAFVARDNPDDVIRREDAQTYSVKKGEKIINRYTNDLYEAVVINNEYVVNKRKKRFVPRAIDKHSDINLPVFGSTETPYSLIGATLDIQKLYDVIYTHMELLIALSGVKSMIMDRSQKPDDMSDNEWNFQKKLGIVNIQTLTKEGNPKRTSFNQWSQIDLTMADGILNLKLILDRLEESMGNIIGVPRQRQAQLKETDQVGTFKESLKQSFLITEILYSDHEEILSEALTQLVTLAGRYAFRNGGKVEMNKLGLGRKILNIPEKIFTNIDLKVSIERSNENIYKMEELRQIAAIHYKNAQLPFSSLIEIYESETFGELKSKVKYFTEKAEKIAQQQRAEEHQRVRELEIEKMRFMNEFDAYWKQQELQIDQTKLQFESQFKEFQAKIESERLELDKVVAETNAKLKLFELTNEKESEDNAVMANDRANTINAKLKELEIMLNYLINKANIIVMKDKNEKDHADRIKKISTDTKIKKTVKEHVSDK
jgi:hypothetical protein